MSLLSTLVDDYHTLRDGKPGERFRSYVEKRRERRGGRVSVGRVLNFFVGLVLIVVGIGIGWLPGPGGFVAIIGLALIAQEIPIIAVGIDRVELLIRKVIHGVKRFLLPKSTFMD